MPLNLTNAQIALSFFMGKQANRPSRCCPIWRTVIFLAILHAICMVVTGLELSTIGTIDTGSQRNLAEDLKSLTAGARKQLMPIGK